MLEGLAQPMHLLVILLIALLFFGPSKLAGLGKSMGEGIRGFKDALREGPAQRDSNNSVMKSIKEESSQR
jgi:sec-independent protein translocase protein TatA